MSVSIDEKARRKSDHQKRVEEFMIKARQEVPNSPTIPSEKVRLLRAKLVFSECVTELIGLGLGVEITVDGYDVTDKDSGLSFDIRGEPNIVEVIDGCADGIVVITGTLSAFGVADLGIQEEVDRANLRKCKLPECPTHGKTMGHMGKGIYVCTRSPCANLPVQGPYRDTDGKWVKAPDFVPPDIERVLHEQGYKGFEEKEKPLTSESVEYAIERARDGSDWTQAAKRIFLRVAEEYLKRNTEDSPLVQGCSVCDADFKASKVAEPLVVRDGENFVTLITAAGAKTGMCGKCKTPLSDELAKRVRTERTRVYRCPNCQEILLEKELKYA